MQDLRDLVAASDVSESNPLDVAIGAALFDVDIRHVALFGYHQNGSLVLDGSNPVRMSAIVMEDRAYVGKLPDRFSIGKINSTEGNPKELSTKQFEKSGIEDLLRQYKTYHLIKNTASKDVVLNNHFEFLRKYAPPNLWEKLHPIQRMGHSVLPLYPHPSSVFLQWDDSAQKYIESGYEFGDSVIVYGKELSSKGRKKLSTLQKYDLNGVELRLPKKGEANG